MKTLKLRKRKSKTDYANRLKLLKNEKPRVVFRRTNRYILVQYVTSREARDKIEFGITSKELIKYGWPKEAEGSLKSIPASYLTGYLIGKQIIQKKMKTPIVDFGMLRTSHKTKVFAFLQGLLDAEVKIKCEKGFPEKERIAGGSLKNKIDFQKIKSNIGNIK